MKEATASLIIDTAHQLKAICKQNDAVFIINDSVSTAQEVDADGVHLGKDDISIKEARSILGAEKIIGATCNSIKEIYFAIENGADYIGLGPYKHTTTKKKLSPILGIEGYRSIMEELNNNKVFFPIVAIGGIELGDVDALMRSGITGVAVSGGILGADDIEKAVKSFIGKIKK